MAQPPLPVRKVLVTELPAELALKLVQRAVFNGVFGALVAWSFVAFAFGVVLALLR
jgi:hypothetical protein